MIGWVYFNLCAKALDVNIKGLGISDISTTPDAIDALGTGQHATNISQEILK
jgi:hypothetical protein